MWEELSYNHFRKALQGWQADALREALGLSSAHCPSSAAVNVIGLATCPCKGGKLMFLGKP